MNVMAQVLVSIVRRAIRTDWETLSFRGWYETCFAEGGREIMKQAIVLIIATVPTVAFAQNDLAIQSRVRQIAANAPPQIGDARRLFDQAAPFEGNLSNQTILCRVSADRNRRYDGAMPRGPVSRRYGAPDLIVRLRVNRQRGVIQGPEDRYTTTVSMPGVSIRRGQRIGIHLADRDALRNDVIGDAVAVYAGQFPIELPGNQANGTCRVLDSAIAERRLPPIFQRTDRELERASRVRVDLRANEITTPQPALDRASYHLYDAAALVGWQHAEVANRRERRNEIDQAHTRALREALDELRRDTPEAGQPVAYDNGRWEARVTQVDCGYSEVRRFDTLRRSRDPRVCAVRLEVATSRGGRFRPQVRALTAAGELTQAVVRVRERNAEYTAYTGERLAPNELHVLWVLTSASPQMLRLKVGSETVFIRAQ